MPRRVVLACLFSLAAMPAAALETLYFQNFEAGESAPGWRIAGGGDVAVSGEPGSRTLRLTGRGGAAITIPVAGPARVRVGAAFIAAGLDRDESCLAEVSADGGRNWERVVHVIGAQADGATLHAGGTWVSVAAEDGAIRIRAWIPNATGGVCRLDNVSVRKQPDEMRQDSRMGRAVDDRQLSVAVLTGDTALAAALPMAEFSRPPGVGPPSYRFTGSLQLHEPGMAASGNAALRIVTDPWDRQRQVGEPLGRLPEFEFRFVQDGETIIPLSRGVQRRSHPYWEIALQPGRAWQEPGDGDWMRIALPFALQERSGNCTHNGVMSWLYRGGSEVSRVAYQVGSETCPYLKLDLWGIVEASFKPEAANEAQRAAIARHAAHAAARLPVMPLIALARHFSGVDPYALATDDGIDPRDISVQGLVVDGVNYRSACPTRFGDHPFCSSLPLPSYSTAKSIFAGVGTMRLEALYPGFARLPIAGLIDICDQPQWRDVTVEHALDMATGNFRSPADEVDEDSVPHGEFIVSDSHAFKLAFACNFFPRKAEPGRRFVYHTSDTYLVGTAMTEFIGRKRPGADAWQDVLAEPLWRRLELSPLLDVTKRTYDQFRQPYTGYGLTYEADDIVRIAVWLAYDGARIDGEAALDTGMLAAALRRVPQSGALPAGTPGLSYDNGLWAYDVGPALGCAGPVRAPFMSGYGGIKVVMFPNGVVYYVFSDSYVHRWLSAARAAHEIRPLCPESVPPEEQN